MARYARPYGKCAGCGYQFTTINECDPGELDCFDCLYCDAIWCDSCGPGTVVEDCMSGKWVCKLCKEPEIQMYYEVDRTESTTWLDKAEKIGDLTIAGYDEVRRTESPQVTGGPGAPAYTPPPPGNGMIEQSNAAFSAFLLAHKKAIDGSSDAHTPKR